jgi:hypothetical protein
VDVLAYLHRRHLCDQQARGPWRDSGRGRQVREKAGHGDARGVSGFSKGRGTTYRAEVGRRWVTDKSSVRSGWLSALQDQFGIDLPDDLTDRV